MGDRANVYIRNDDKNGVYLYTHNGGTGLPAVLREALARRVRWDDPGYLARIIFESMTSSGPKYGDPSMDSELGYGIYASGAPDGRECILVVDCEKKTVARAIVRGKAKKITVQFTWSFEEFLLVDQGTVWSYRSQAKSEAQPSSSA